MLLHGEKRIGSLYQFQAHLPDKSIQPSFEAGSRTLKAQAILVFMEHSVSLLSNEVLALKLLQATLPECLFNRPDGLMLENHGAEAPSYT